MAWCLAAGVGVIWAIYISRNYLSWPLWGIWLFIGVTIGGSIFEIVLLAIGDNIRGENNKRKCRIGEWSEIKQKPG